MNEDYRALEEAIEYFTNKFLGQDVPKPSDTVEYWQHVFTVFGIQAKRLMRDAMVQQSRDLAERALSEGSTDE